MSRYAFAGIIVAVLVGVPVAYCICQKRHEHLSLTDGVAPSIRVDCRAEPDHADANGWCIGGLVIPIEPASQQIVPVQFTHSQGVGLGLLGNELKLRKLTLNEAIAATIKNPIRGEAFNLDSSILNAEIAYWKLYEAYGRVHAAEDMLRVLATCWKVIEDTYFELPGCKDLAPLQAKYHEFRNERYVAAGEVLDAERNLRVLMGLPDDDGMRLVPITPAMIESTPPVIEYYQLNYDDAHKSAMAL